MKRNIIYILLAVIAATTSTIAQELIPAWKTDTLLRVPESVLFDRKSNILYVANINGKSDQVDGNGFISKVTTDGKIENLKWVTGLNAPKGMALIKGKLYVADLNAVAVIDLASAKLLKTIPIEGAKFLNDVTASENGDVYVSDSATGKIHLIKNDEASLYFESTEFKRINGLLALKDELYIADAGNGVHYKLSKDKQLQKFSETSQGADGIVQTGKNEYIVSSWGGEIYFVSADGKSLKMLDTKDQKLNSADIGYDEKTSMVFVPTFFGNSVMAYRFKK
jgi:DNA-binding beta-propeller fold protein YncE